MNDDCWKRKYLKYKMKYLRKIKQTGGAIADLINIERLFPMDALSFDVKTGVTLNGEEAHAIDSMLNIILPMINFRGVKIDNINNKMTVKKITNLNDVYIDVDNKFNIHMTPYEFGLNEERYYYDANIRPTRNRNLIKYYCLVPNVIPSAILSIQSNDTIMSFDNIRADDMNEIAGRPLMTITENIETTAVSLIDNSEVGRQRFINNNLPVFLNDMISAIKYLHSLDYQHNQVSLDNISVARDIRGGGYTCKLFNFAKIEKIRNYEQMQPNLDHDNPINTLTIFARQRSILYDWYCLYICVLRLLSEIESQVNLNNMCVVYKDTHQIVGEALGQRSLEINAKLQWLDDFIMRIHGNPDRRNRNVLNTMHVLSYTSIFEEIIQTKARLNSTEEMRENEWMSSMVKNQIDRKGISNKNLVDLVGKECIDKRENVIENYIRNFEAMLKFDK